LQVIGYGEIADRLSFKGPNLSISLSELAKMYDTGMELAFFETLKGFMQQAALQNIASLEFQDLPECVKKLKSAKVWSLGCRNLQEEIIAYIREYAFLYQINTKITIK